MMVLAAWWLWLLPRVASAEEWQWWEVVRNTSKDFAQLLEDYPSVSAAERAKGLGRGGKFVTVVADRHGLGNRIGPIVGGFALALATGRALAIHWPRVRCSAHPHKKDCDPAGINDLFEPPAGVDWSLPEGRKMPGLCAKGPWLLRGNAPQLVDRIRTTNGLGNGQRFREHWANICVDSDRDFAWGVTCHADVTARFPSPWLTSGGLMAYLLRPNRVVTAKAAAVRESSCALAVHLRKTDRGPLPSKVVTPTVIVPAYLDASNRSGAAGVYVAADDRSIVTRRVLVEALVAAGARLLAPVASGPATRANIDGIQTALAENFVLSSCYDIMPKGTGYSTFHDVAFARLVFMHQWPQARVNQFVEKYTTPGPHKFAIAPAECPTDKLKEPTDSKKKVAAAAARGDSSLSESSGIPWGLVGRSSTPT